MKQGIFEIVENSPVSRGTMRMRLKGDTSAITRPGQFINIKLDGFFLRRPISVCDRDSESVTIIYKVVGRGTEKMSRMSHGSLDVLSGLGNGFDVSSAGKQNLLAGGGVGAAPLYFLARELISAGRSVTAALGFNTASEAYYEQKFADLGADVIIATADGSRGVKGFVTAAMAQTEYDYFYTCGPEPMLRAVYAASRTDGQFSFEERMGCGFGACMGCSCRTLYGSKRICRDGPVLTKEEIIWGD